MLVITFLQLDPKSCMSTPHLPPPAPRPHPWPARRHPQSTDHHQRCPVPAWNDPTPATERRTGVFDKVFGDPGHDRSYHLLGSACPPDRAQIQGRLKGGVEPVVHNTLDGPWSDPRGRPHPFTRTWSVHIAPYHRKRVSPILGALVQEHDRKLNRHAVSTSAGRDQHIKG